MKNLIATIGLFVFAIQLDAQTTVTFESLPVPGAGFFNGDIAASGPYRDNFTITGVRNGSGVTETLQQWEHGDIDFFNRYTATYDSWSGFSWSNVSDSATPGYGNQYAAFPGGGSDGMEGTAIGQTYAVAFGSDAWLNLPERSSLISVDLANTTYTALAIQNGDSFSKQFGGASGDDSDYFSVTLTGYDAQTTVADPDNDGEFETVFGDSIGSIEIPLADYRFADNAQDYILDAWQRVDLSPLADARSIGITYFSTDVGMFGINTPQYVALDNLTYSITAVPEPNGIFLLGFLAFVRRRTHRRPQSSGQ